MLTVGVKWSQIKLLESDKIRIGQLLAHYDVVLAAR